ncbi:MAG: hypothetical protein ACLR7F_13650 [Waltera sp.]
MSNAIPTEVDLDVLEKILGALFRRLCRYWTVMKGGVDHARTYPPSRAGQGQYPGSRTASWRQWYSISIDPPQDADLHIM